MPTTQSKMSVVDECHHEELSTVVTCIQKAEHRTEDKSEESFEEDNYDLPKIYIKSTKLIKLKFLELRTTIVSSIQAAECRTEKVSTAVSSIQEAERRTEGVSKEFSEEESDDKSDNNNGSDVGSYSDQDPNDDETMKYVCDVCNIQFK